MTAPAYQPAPQYPPQFVPGYPPVYQQPAYQPPQQQFPQFAPGYPPAAAMPAAAPLAQGTLEDFYSQPSTGGGKALKFGHVGQAYVGVVARPINAGDVQQQTDTQGKPQTFRDGRPKFVLKVPLQLQPTAEFPDGTAQWFVKGQARDELVRAMAEAGAPAGPPEAGAIVQVTFVGQRASGPGMNPAKQFHVLYTRPDGQTSSPAPATPPPAAQPAPQAYAPAPAAPMQAYAMPAQPQYQQPAPPPAAPQPVAPAGPADLSAEQQALLARLTGNAQG